MADPELQPKLPEILERSIKAGVRGWVLGGVHPGDWEDQKRVQALFGPTVIPCAGLHPWWVSRQSEDGLNQGIESFAQLIQKSPGIGEIGLDFSPNWNTPESVQLQERAIARAFELCRGTQKPLVLHVVQAHSKILALIDRWGPFAKGGIVHGFTGSIEVAREYVKRGFLISIGKGILKLGFTRLKKAAQELDDDQILLETDSHEPAELIEVATALATLRKTDTPQILTKTSLNLCRLFEI